MARSPAVVNNISPCKICALYGVNVQVRAFTQLGDTAANGAASIYPQEVQIVTDQPPLRDLRQDRRATRAPAPVQADRASEAPPMSALAIQLRVLGYALILAAAIFAALTAAFAHTWPARILLASPGAASLAYGVSFLAITRRPQR